MLDAVLSWQQLGERGEKGPGSEGSVARARGDRGLPRYGPSANTGMFTMCTNYDIINFMHILSTMI